MNRRILAALAAAAQTAAHQAFCAANVETQPSVADQAFYAAHFETQPSVAALTALGRSLFVDPALSASGRLSCATCHSPARAFGPANDLAVQLGGADGRHPGVRAVPSLRYLQNVPAFTEHYVDDDGDDSVDQGPAGGLTWDGRAQSAHEQAQLPLLSPFEMANTSTGAVVFNVQRSGLAAQFRAVFGPHLFEDPALAFKAVLLSLETYQQNPAEFYPYSSKYDAWLRHQASLTDPELRGLDAFNDPARGNCARCHPSAIRRGAFPQFTDFGYAAIGVPRNPLIPANADPGYHDLGLCGPLRTDLADKPEYCGMFRTPTLRNVALRPVFFHNGVIHRLADAVRFYAERDTRPQEWFRRPSAVGTQATVGTQASVGKQATLGTQASVGKQATVGKQAPAGTLAAVDLPSRYLGNLDRAAPFDRHPGDRPPLSAGDVQAIVAFLNTLTDGWAPPAEAPPAEVAPAEAPPAIRGERGAWSE